MDSEDVIEEVELDSESEGLWFDESSMDMIGCSDSEDNGEIDSADYY